MSVSKYIDLPNDGKLPIVGFGTYNKNPEDLEKALHYALEVGYRHLDTAFVYQNERIIGKVLNEWLTKGKIKREELFVTTKLPNTAMLPDQVESSIKESLKNLQLDYVDLYLMHGPFGIILNKETKEMVTNPNSDFIAVWKEMEKQVDGGRTRYIGLSNFNIGQIERVLRSCKIRPACLQIELHAHLQQHDLVDYCKKENIAVVAYSPLANPSFNDILAAHKLPTKQLPNVLGDATIKKIADKHSKSPAQILLRLLIERGISVIPKSATPSRILENISIFDFELNNDDINELRKLDVGEAARICTFRFLNLETHPEYPFGK